MAEHEWELEQVYTLYAQRVIRMNTEIGKLREVHVFFH